MPGYADAIAARIKADNDWRTTIRPVNDTLRDRSRDALVAHILQHLSSNPPPPTSTPPTGCSTTS